MGFSEAHDTFAPGLLRAYCPFSATLCEHLAWRNLHIVAELKVTDEVQCLTHRGKTPGLKHHHCNQSARDQIANDELRNDVKTDILASESPKDSNRDRERKC